MQLLHRQAGIVNFKPLRRHFLSIYAGARVYLPTLPALKPLTVAVMRNPSETDQSRMLPAAVINFQNIVRNQLQEAYRNTTRGKFAEARDVFRDILQSLLLVVATKSSEVDEVRRLSE